MQSRFAPLRSSSRSFMGLRKAGLRAIMSAVRRMALVAAATTDATSAETAHAARGCRPTRVRDGQRGAVSHTALPAMSTPRESPGVAQLLDGTVALRGRTPGFGPTWLFFPEAFKRSLLGRGVRFRMASNLNPVTDRHNRQRRQTDRQTPRSNSSETDNRFRMALYAYANCPHCGLYCRHCRLSVCVLCHVCESRTLPCLRPTCTRVRSALREDGQQTDVRRTGCRFW